MLLAPLFPALPLTVFSCYVLFAPSPPCHALQAKKGRGRRRGRKGKGKKRNPLPFSLPPNPLLYPFLSRLPPLKCLDQGIHFGSILAVARLGFKRRATAVPKTIHKL